MSAPHSDRGQGQAVSADPGGDALAAAATAAAVLVAVLVALPLVVAVLVVAVVSVWRGPVSARYWLVPRWWVPVAAVGAVAAAGVWAWEAVKVVAWACSPAAERFFAGGVGRWWPQAWRDAWPWLAVNAVLGVLLVPVVWSWRRRRVARRVYRRQYDDVVRQEQIERARAVAEDWTAARRIGVAMDPVTGTFAPGGGDPGLSGPREVGAGVQAVGLVTRPTVRTWRERRADRRVVPDWTDPSRRWLVLPGHASAVRALLLAESGTGKTVLLASVVQAAAAAGWPVVFIDAKGDPADAAGLARRLAGTGRTTAVGPGWDLFSGTAAQVTERLMRLLPPGEGAARHYSDEARGILGMIQARAPLRSAADLAGRLRNPGPHVAGTGDRALVEAVVEPRTGQTAGGRVAASLAVALRPLEPYLAAGGWTFEDPGADVVVVPLTPVDAAQARVGDLLLLGVRQWMADRLASGDKRPALLVVDEFPQLVTTDTNPGDVAAALFETARSAGLGLILAGQSPAGLSGDDTLRQRALSSGAALMLGRSKDPEAVVRLAGTTMRLEASGEAHSGILGSGRAQHAYVLPPQAVREAWDGRFWLVHRGAVASLRVLPPTPAAPPATEPPAPGGAAPAGTATAAAPALSTVPGPAPGPPASPPPVPVPVVPRGFAAGGGGTRKHRRKAGT